VGGVVRVDPAERLLYLLIALVHARGRLTKAQIRASVTGYNDDASDEAFERRFERDKDLLRQLGVPIITDIDPVHEDEVGYRLDDADYALPDIRFTAAEIGVLSLAAEVWQDADLAESARRGLTKLRARGAPLDPRAREGLALRIRGAEGAFTPLLNAINNRQAVTFDYRAASTGEQRRRTVQPWRLLSQWRGWYLIGFDVDREAPRVFRLSRIVSRVRGSGPRDAYTIPEHDGAALLEATDHGPRQAFLAVDPERGAALRARAVAAEAPTPPPGLSPPAERDVIIVPMADEEVLAAELAPYGGSVIVLAPASLREAVLRRLRAVAALGADDE